MKCLNLFVAVGLCSTVAACSSMEFKGAGILRKAEKTTSAMTGEGVAAKSEDQAKPVAEDTSGEELKKLLEATGEGLGREGGDMGLKDGCAPKRKIVKEAASAQATASLFGRGGWGGGGDAPPPPPMIDTTFIDATECISDMLKSEPLSLCRFSTASGNLAECVRWSRISPEKKESQADCQQKADILSGVGTNPIRQGALPKKEFFFVCQKTK